MVLGPLSHHPHGGSLGPQDLFLMSRVRVDYASSWFLELSITNRECISRSLRGRYLSLHPKVFPDSIGGSRKTATADASTTGHMLLKWAGIEIHNRQSPFAIRDKYQTLNWLIRSVAGRCRLMVNPRCRDLKFMLYKEETDQLEKSDQAHSHQSNALGYCALGARLKPQSSTSITVY